MWTSPAVPAGWPVKDVILDDGGMQTSACDMTCDATRGMKNHRTWPVEWETRMLEFLKGHGGS